MVAALVFVGAAACGGSEKAAVKLDGSPRVPDVQGVVAKAGREGIKLEGGRNFEVSPDLIAFSTYNRKPIQLAATIGDYVQLGVDNGEVKWLALIGVVMTDEKGHRTASYQGQLVRISGRRLDFKDGTVLTLAKGLTAPADGLGLVYAAIDVKRGLVQGATFPPANGDSTTRPTNS